MFSFDRPVKMKRADDQFGIGGMYKDNLASYSIEDKKNVIGVQKKLKINPNYVPKPFERESLQRQLRSEKSGNDSTQIAGLSRGEIKQEKNELKMILNSGMPLTEKQRNDIINKITGVVPITDASKSKQYSDTVTIDGKTFENRRGAGYGGGLEVETGIKTPAPETKRMAGDFFSPKNFQKSGSPDATIMTREQVGQALTGDPGYSRFGTRDAEGTQAAKDTAAFNQRVKSDFFSPVKADARSITERREANVQSM